MKSYNFLVLDEALTFLLFLVFNSLCSFVFSWTDFRYTCTNAFMVDRALEPGICGAKKLVLNWLILGLEGAWQIVAIRAWSRLSTLRQFAELLLQIGFCVDLFWVTDLE